LRSKIGSADGALRGEPQVLPSKKQYKNRALLTFPPVLHWSIISGAAFDFWVRDGIRSCHSPWNTRKL